MYKIAIIGAGQLGSRHLQGLAKSSFAIQIEVIDPFEDSLHIAKQRYLEIEKSKYVKNIYFNTSIDQLSDKIDLVIVATGANVRSKVIIELLTKKTVTNLILEKVLFQSIEEYRIIDELLNETNTKCWVNHPRRMFPIYKTLRDELKNANNISYNFQGGDWGLGCNSLHFIDHLAFLSNSTELELDSKYLDNEIYPSKRKGFSEFNGLLVGSLSNNNFTLSSNVNHTQSIFTIVSDVISIIIDESKGEMLISRKENDWKWESKNEKIIYFQSELTNILINDILIENKCELPTYKDASKLHLPFIKCLLDHMQKITGQEHKNCPIT
jgi:hypothetical protein